MRRRRLSHVVIVLLLAGVFLVPGVLADAASSRATRFVSTENTKSLASLLEYWTPERMAATRPIRMPSRSGSPRASAAPVGADGPAVTVVGGEPGEGFRPSRITRQAAGDPSVQSHYYDYPYPYTRTEVFPNSLYKKYPWSTNGRLFFSAGSCSATAVTSGSAPRRALVLTAGHCVSNGNGSWYTDFLFCPARRDGRNPYGCWGWVNATTTGEWFYNGNFKRDVAFIITSKDPNGRSLGDVVGDTGFGWNWSPVQHFWDNGYPAEPPFTGERHILCTASTAHRDSFAGEGPDPLGIGCDMNRGSSGGSWKWGWTLNGPGVANSVNSYKYFSSQPEAMYGPYFDTTIGDLWNFAVSLIGP